MRRRIIYLLMAGVAAVVAAMIVYSALKKREAEVRQALVKSTEIVVAAHDLPLGARIGRDAVKLARWSRDSIPPGSFTNPKAIMNALVKAPFVTNEPIVSSKLYSGKRGAGVMPLLIPAGMRAMSVPVDEVSDIAGFVQPHTRVDVLAAISGNGPNERPFAKIVLQDVEVLAVAQEIEGSQNKPKVVKVVTLLVKPEQAERLALASREGTLRLVMRSYNDRAIVSTTGADLASLFGRPQNNSPVHPAHDETPRIKQHPSRSRSFQVQVMRDGVASESVSFIKEKPLDGKARWLMTAPRTESSKPAAAEKFAQPRISPAKAHPDGGFGADYSEAASSTPNAYGAGAAYESPRSETSLSEPMDGALINSAQPKTIDVP